MEIKASIHIGLGDILYIKGMLEPAKHRFNRIELTFNKNLLGLHDNDYPKFLRDLGGILFAGHPYVLSDADHPHLSVIDLIHDYKLIPTKPELGHLMCRGTPLNLDCEYIVMTTKIRYFKRNLFDNYSQELFNEIRELSKRYKIVILGERMIQMNQEYINWGPTEIYSIYNDLVRNIPPDRLVDLTFPELGITSPKLAQVQQDCLHMKNAKMVITLGVGGNFCMATSVANTVGFRADNDDLANDIFENKIYNNAIVTKHWGVFMDRLRQYR